MRTVVFAMLVWLAWVPQSALCEITVQEFFAQYEPAAIRLREIYANMTMSGRYIQGFKVRGSQTESRIGYQFTIYSEGSRLCADLHQFEGKLSRPADSAFVVAPKMSFAVDRQDRTKPYELKRLKRQDQGPPNEMSIRLRLYAAFCPYADMDGVAILERLKHASTTIIGITEKNQDSDTLVTVSARFQLRPPSPRDKPLPEWTGSYTFSKTRGWVLQESTRSTPDAHDIRVSCNVTYGAVVNGIPVLKRGEFWRDTPTDRIRIADCQVDEFKPGAPPLHEFTPAAFGVRDPRDE